MSLVITLFSRAREYRNCMIIFSGKNRIDVSDFFKVDFNRLCYYATFGYKPVKHISDVNSFELWKGAK